jgi:hypothetical protein
VDFSEARDLFVNIFRISDLTAKIVDRGLIFEKGRGLSAKWWGFSGFRIIFNIKMMVDSVHSSWTTGGSVHHGPLSGTDRRPPERGGMLAEVRSRTAPELGSSPVRVRCGEGRTVKPARRSPRLVRRCGGWAATASRRRERRSEVAMFDLGEEGRRRGLSAARVG